jgi:putative glutamine amidotransferase
VQGILLPGSPTDVDPKHYGAARHEKLGKLYPDRDATDFAILDLVEQQRDMPVLGICFGNQSLNVHRGGSLVQTYPRWSRIRSSTMKMRPASRAACRSNR